MIIMTGRGRLFLVKTAATAVHGRGTARRRRRRRRRRQAAATTVMRQVLNTAADGQ
jgi:hypothetical protein